MRKGKGGGRGNGLLPNSIRIISSCLRTVSTNAGTVVRSAGATVAASIAAAVDDQKDQVLWAGFDKLELGTTAFRHVLLLGYFNGFQVVDIEDSSNVRELVSKRDGPVTFLQMLPIPNKLEGHEAYRASHPLLLVVAGDEANDTTLVQGAHLGWPTSEPQPGHGVPSPTAVRFYSLRSYSYVHVLRFRSAVYMIRCSPRIIAVALAAQIYCFDAITLENKFSLLTYPMPQGGQGRVGVNIGYSPMTVGPRWLAYASNNPLLSNTGRLSPQNLTPSPGVSPSTSPSSGNLVARYAMESSKQLAAGIINLGDIGYKTLSKYCQDFLPDGSSSPVSPSSSWKVGKVTSAAHPTEADNAGMVVIKDFVSKAIVSQFRAHTSPISALCFDPTGTLLVTASVHGHSINVFRIMPSRVQSASDSACYDWSSSHVHLYKLYRGLTAAVIQDICFSHYSQWVAIVSSRGTCHIFVFPFGGDVGLKTQSAHNDVPPLLPSLSSPWWSASSCMTNQQPRPPPPPVTLSVVSRVKNGNFGLLNTISNAATSATGRISVPSGAVAAIFHNSIYKNLQQVHLKCNALEHLIVYSPSGHIIQHDLLLSSGIESCDDNFRSGLGQLAPVQDEELRVRAEPVQWWDVCRRSNWPEREVYFSGMTLDRFETAEVVMDTSDCEDNDTMYLESHKNTLAVNYLVKTHEKPHWYLSNAEVQISSGRIPIWQKSKICIYAMIPFEADELKFVNECSGGEIEIEKIPVHLVEIRRKDLLPVFEHSQSIPSGWVDRELVQGRNQSFSSSGHYTNDEFKEAVGFSRSKSASLGSVESSDVGTTAGTPENLLDLDQVIQVRPYGPVGLQSMETQIAHRSVQYSATTTNFKKELNSEKRGSTVGDDCIISGLSCNSLYVGRPDTEGAFSSSNSLGSETSNTASSNPFALCPNIHAETEHGDSHNSLHFAQCLHEGYCQISELDDCCELAEVVNDADSSSSHCEREKAEEDGDSDDMLGGISAFSEG